MLEGIKAYSVAGGISTTVAYGVACLTLALAAWSFVDFVRCRRSGDVKTMTLGLRASVKQRIHKVIRVGLSTRGLALGSAAVGVLVALLESVGTGQVYLPVIMFIVRAPGLRADAIAYPLLYNVMFIAPLVAILVIAYLAAAKLAMALLFLGLDILVLLTV